MNVLKKMWHILIKRDIKTIFYTKGFDNFGKGSILYKPLYINPRKAIQIGDNTTILNGARLQVYNNLTGLKSKIQIGNDCYLGYNISILAGEQITIGNGVLMASNILITSENHRADPEPDLYYMQQPLKCKPVEIKEGSWIGERACILQGVTIGKKCVIGAGSVVTRDIPDYCIAAGSPAKVIKQYNFTTHNWENVNR